MSPLISSIVLNYRSPLDAVQCVKALLKQTIGDQLEILVIDNDSDDESIGSFRARWIHEPRVRVMESHANVGFSRGNNDAARHARGEYLLFINPDNTLPPDGLERMLEIFRENPNTGIVGPALVYPDGTVRPSARKFPTIADLLRKRLFPSHWQNEHTSVHAHLQKQSPAQSSKLKVRSYPVDWLVGACILMPRTLFSDLGGFDPRFFLFFEDIDLCRRCQLAGHRILYAPGIRVLDRRQRLSEMHPLSFLWRRIGRIHTVSAVKYFWKWRRLYSSATVPP